jgi:divinyl chlorophyllide a 8-vinyl-reductase
MNHDHESAAKSRRALVAGATGYIGRAVVRELLNRGFAVVALLRQESGGRAEDLAGAELRVCDPCDPNSMWEQAFRGDHFDVVISCIASRSGAPNDVSRVDWGANVNLLKGITNPKTCHFILLSAICVQRPKLAFQFAKLEFEERLKNSGLRYSIVRPTAYFKSLAGQLERVKRGGAYLVFGDGELTACKPVGEADLAAFMVDCIDDPERHNAVLPIGGPGPALTPRQQAEILFRLLDKPSRLRRVPVALLDGIISVLSVLSRVVPPLADKAEFARIGRYYATESMLVWDEEKGEYDAAATPETGEETLEAFFSRVLEQGMAGQELGDHAFFDRGK